VKAGRKLYVLSLFAGCMMGMSMPHFHKGDYGIAALFFGLGWVFSWWPFQLANEVDKPNFKRVESPPFIIDEGV
jgi:hypothetical protein